LLREKAGVGIVSVVVVVDRGHDVRVHVVGELAVVRAGAGGRRGNASGGIVAVGEIGQLLGVFPPLRDGTLVVAGFLGPPDPGLQKSEIPPP
jgi:hypothetical protein